MVEMKEIQITDIKGIKVGHAQNAEAATGCTVILCEKGAPCGVDVRGSAPATRETDAIRPGNVCQMAHGVMLSGGSAFGLEAAQGAMEYLEKKGIGFDVGVTKVPIISGASLFDLQVGSHEIRPDKEMGKMACENAFKELPEEGNVGAGMGATIGKLLGPDRMMKSGLGIYAVQVGMLQVGAVVAVNALGDVFDMDTGVQIGGLLSKDKKGLIQTEKLLIEQYEEMGNLFSDNTTIGCIVTNTILDNTMAGKIASMAHDGMARAIRPIHTLADGDAIFTLATGEVAASPNAVGTLAAYVMGKAINRGVKKAKDAYGLLCAANL